MSRCTPHEYPSQYLYIHIPVYICIYTYVVGMRLVCIQIHSSDAGRRVRQTLVLVCLSLSQEVSSFGHLFIACGD